MVEKSKQEAPAKSEGEDLPEKTNATIVKIRESIKIISENLHSVEESHKTKTRKLEDRVQGVEDRLCRLIDQVSYSKGFYDGRKYIVSRAEEILCEQVGCKTREELATSGKLPSFWAATLVLCLNDPANVLDLAKKEGAREKEGE